MSPGHQEFWEFDEQSIVAHLKDASQERLTCMAGSGLLLEVFQLLEFNRVFLGVGSDTLGRREMFGDGG